MGKIVTMRGVGQLYVTTRLQRVGEEGREEQMVLEYGLNMKQYLKKAGRCILTHLKTDPTKTGQSHFSRPPPPLTGMGGMDPPICCSLCSPLANIAF